MPSPGLPSGGVARSRRCHLARHQRDHTNPRQNTRQSLLRRPSPAAAWASAGGRGVVAYILSAAQDLSDVNTCVVRRPPRGAAQRTVFVPATARRLSEVCWPSGGRVPPPKHHTSLEQPRGRCLFDNDGGSPVTASTTAYALWG